ASARKPGVPKAAVLNADDASYDRLRILSYDRLLTYGLDHPADLSVRDPRFDGGSTGFIAETPIGPIDVESRLLGRFNVSNALAAIGAALALGVDGDAIARGLASFQGVPGRLEPIAQGQPFGVVVDFAHTPNSLRRVLELARSLTAGRVAVVFGCAGLRDAAKRPLMGAA